MVSSNIQISTITKQWKKPSNIFYTHIGLFILSINPLDNFYEGMHTIIRIHINLPIFLCPAHINFLLKSISVRLAFTEASIVPEAVGFSEILRLLCSLQVWLFFSSPYEFKSLIALFWFYSIQQWDHTNRRKICLLYWSWNMTHGFEKLVRWYCAQKEQIEL